MELTRNVIYRSKENLSVYHLQKELGLELALTLSYNEKKPTLSCQGIHSIDVTFYREVEWLLYLTGFKI